jgi:hypothetical protein
MQVHNIVRDGRDIVKGIKRVYYFCSSQMAFKMYLNYCPRILVPTDRSFMLRFENDFLLLNMEYSANHVNKVDQFQYFCGMVQGALKTVMWVNLFSSYKYQLDALFLKNPMPWSTSKCVFLMVQAVSSNAQCAK